MACRHRNLLLKMDRSLQCHPQLCAPSVVSVSTATETLRAHTESKQWEANVFGHLMPLQAPFQVERREFGELATAAATSAKIFLSLKP